MLPTGGFERNEEEPVCQHAAGSYQRKGLGTQGLQAIPVPGGSGQRSSGYLRHFWCNDYFPLIFQDQSTKSELLLPNSLHSAPGLLASILSLWPCQNQEFSQSGICHTLSLPLSLIKIKRNQLPSDLCSYSEIFIYLFVISSFPMASRGHRTVAFDLPKKQKRTLALPDILGASETTWPLASASDKCQHRDPSSNKEKENGLRMRGDAWEVLPRARLLIPGGMAGLKATSNDFHQLASMTPPLNTGGNFGFQCRTKLKGFFFINTSSQLICI